MPGANKKIQPRLAPLMHEYLQDLADTELYGKSPTEVAQSLIEEGIRNAIGKNLIERRKPGKKRKHR